MSKQQKTYLILASNKGYIRFINKALNIDL